MNRDFKTFLNYFVRGLLLIAPVGITIFILYSAFDFVDSLVRIRFDGGEGGRHFFIPGLGFVIVVFGIYGIGFLFTRILPQTISNWIENGIKNLPLVRIIYSAFKDLISAFVGDKKKFNRPVKVIINKDSNVWKVGFLTQESLDDWNMGDMASVYCPHSYAFSGEMFIVPKEHIQPLNMSSAEAMKLIISGGVSGGEQ
ncbi:DUF502 domain-containing protein [Marinilongibacter aquaticus]|uniref:DUF502 domain-containing protein n=1 Tax=Marinilongibacter aquaticus TaxID=2975157 RepID=UPI0021BD4E6C|nr:DUF502 domain-containing protein [Marinilongibacter aquaticus]UBM58967.1 DUF502 domain-containing protein [Marinilongibacter aquaticus]